MAGGRSVLVVDDEADLRTFLDENLRCDDWRVHTASCGAQARSRMRAFQPDIVLLDVGLPDESGFEVCRSVRETDPSVSGINPGTPIIMLTARGEDIDRVRGFRRGAQDYVTKPFYYPELLLRMESLLGRSAAQLESPIIRAPGIEVNISTRSVMANGKPVSVSAKEFALLCMMGREPYKVFSRSELLKSVWGFQAAGRTRTLDTHASRLRKKLAATGATHDYLVNVWGVGYRLVSGEPGQGADA